MEGGNARWYDAILLQESINRSVIHMWVRFMLGHVSVALVVH